MQSVRATTGAITSPLPTPRNCVSTCDATLMCKVHVSVRGLVYRDPSP